MEKVPNKSPFPDSDLLSKQAEIFRSKLIADFHLLESIDERGSRQEVPKYYTSDIQDHTAMRKIIKKHPMGLVRFQVYSNKGEKTLVTYADRRRNRLKNKNSKYLPLDLWAHQIVESPFFQNFILALIILNSIVLGIQSETNDREGDPVIDQLKLILDVFDYCTLFIFVLEILLKWVDSFWEFWKNNWNIFDFFVTFFSFVPEIINFSKGSGQTSAATADLTSIANSLRTFRITRSLKMVSRFQKVRLIILAVTKAFQAMVFISVLLLVSAYIFAIIGVMFYKDGYENAKPGELNYKDSFSSVPKALLTLFQLFTLDHWLWVYHDVTRANIWFGMIYIILWIILGSFIFRNIFVGIMVNNFQNIRNDLFSEVEEIKDREERDIQMVAFAEELERQQQKKKSSIFHISQAVELKASLESLEEEHLLTSETLHDINRPAAGAPLEVQDGTRSPRPPPLQPQERQGPAQQTHLRAESTASVGLRSVASRFQSVHDLKEALSEHVGKMERDSSEWQHIVERNLENLAKEETSYCWPKDSLFRYFLMMEALQENLQEREQLLALAVEALLHIHDT